MNKNCFLFYGDDHFSIKKETEKVFRENEIDLSDVETYDAEEEGIDNALTGAMTLPFLSERKGVVIKNSLFLTEKISLSESDTKKLIDFCEMKLDQTVLVIQITTSDIDKKSKIFKYLNQNIETKAFVKDDKSFDIYQYIKNELKKHKMTIQAYALSQFINRAYTNFDNLNNELQKLIYYSYGNNEINSDMVMAVISREVEDNVYDLVNALLEKDKDKVFKVYNDLILHNVKTTQIIAVLANKFLEILYTKSLIGIKYSKLDIEKFFGYSSGRVYYMMKNAKETDYDLLYDNIRKIENLDYQIKSGKIDKDLGMELFFLTTDEWYD